MADKDTDDRWTVRGVSPEARRRAMECARQRDVLLGEWVTAALSDAADRQAGDRVLPPVRHGGHNAAVRPETPVSPPDSPPGLPDVPGVTQLLLAMGAAGDALAPGARAALNALVRDAARVAHGLPISPPKRRTRQTAQVLTPQEREGEPGPALLEG